VRATIQRIAQKYCEKMKVVYDERGKLLKSIPKFWFHACTSHPILAKQLNSKNRDIFDEYLSSIEVEDNQDVSSGYSITFNFEDNPYFHNPSIANSLTFHKGKVKEVKATTIQWKEEKSMPNVARRRWNDGLVHEQSSYDLSFFNWFHSRKEKNELKYGDQLADLIKNKFWIDPLKHLVETDENEDEEDKVIKFTAKMSRNINSVE